MTRSYTSWLVTCIHSYPMCILTDLSNSSRNMRQHLRPQLLQSGFRNTLGSLNLRWPINSPDFNNIEHIWDALQRAFQNRSPLLILLRIYTDIPTGCMVSIPSSIISDNSLKMFGSACSRGPYAILGRCTSFFEFSVYMYSYIYCTR